MKLFLFGVLLGALIALFPAAFGALVVAAAGQPIVWAFAAGLYVSPRLAARFRRSVR